MIAHTAVTAHALTAARALVRRGAVGLPIDAIEAEIVRACYRVLNADRELTRLELANARERLRADVAATAERAAVRQATRNGRWN